MNRNIVHDNNIKLIIIPPSVLIRACQKPRKQRVFFTISIRKLLTGPKNQYLAQIVKQF